LPEPGIGRVKDACDLSGVIEAIGLTVSAAERSEIEKAAPPEYKYALLLLHPDATVREPPATCPLALIPTASLPSLGQPKLPRFVIEAAFVFDAAMICIATPRASARGVREIAISSYSSKSRAERGRTLKIRSRVPRTKHRTQN
jgi:hypothetical protein